MALYLHLGSAGSGKSRGLREQVLKEAEQNFERNFLFVVPEQFTLQTQRDMIASGRGGIMNVDVLSFPRLAHRVFEELGIKTPVILEDTGKTMIVKKVALDHADELNIYAGKVHRQGFIAEMKSVIAEFYQYGIGPEELDRMLEVSCSVPRLAGKLKDIKVIYNGFRDFISGRFIMNEELLEILIDRAGESKVLKNACVCFDGFTGFTTIQLRVISRLIELGCDIHVTLTIDPEAAGRPADAESLFGLPAMTIRKLTRIADRAGTSTVTHVCTEGVPFRFRNSPALAVIEKNIFRRMHEPAKISEGVYPVSCENPSAEIRFIIGQIRRLVREKNMRYRDFAVVTGDMEVYRRIADREFTAAGIPFFIDSKRNILGTAPVELLRAVIEAADTDFSYESVFRVLKTGCTPIDDDSISALENYCLARAIRGRRMWEATWEKAYRTRYPVDMNAINDARSMVIELLGPAVSGLCARDASVRDRIAVLKDILAACNIEAGLAAAAEEYKQSPDYESRLAALENGQLYGMIEAVFERITMLLGDDVIPLGEFREILDTGFTEAKLALIPQGGDSVIIGDLERTRLDNIKTLFFPGVNEGIVPSSGTSGGLLSDAERSLLAENDFELSPTRRQNVYLNEYYLYLCFTGASDSLYMSYHRMTADKKPGRASYVYTRVLKLFDGLEVHHYFAGDPELLVGSDRGLKSAAALMRDKKPDGLNDQERTVLTELLMRDPAMYRRLLDAACCRRGPDDITPEHARELYGSIITGSATMLEQYAACAFAHFIGYGLRLEERPEYKLGTVEIGNIYHKALENYCTYLKNDGISWHEADREVSGRYCERAIEDAFSGYGDILNDSSRNEYIKTRVERIMTRTVGILRQQIIKGGFEPVYFEKSFLHAGEFMALNGKIDRMDIAEQDGKKYLRVIDYKSGNRRFELDKLLNGLQIQLAVYMNEGLKEISGKDVETGFAGMFYYNIDDPIIETSSEETNIDEAVRNALRLKGPCNGDPGMMKLHDEGLVEDDGSFTKNYNSGVICAKVTGRGELSRSVGTVYSDEEFDTIGRYVDKLVSGMCGEVLEGRAGINPYEMGGKNACTYCKYSGICGFDRRMGDRFRTIRKPSEDEIWENLRGALNSST